MCVCSEQSFEVAGGCVPASTLLPAIILPALALLALATALYVRHAARASDIRTIALAELSYSDPKEVLAHAHLLRPQGGASNSRLA